MSKPGHFATILKIIVKTISILLVQIAKIILIWIPKLLQQLFRAINIRMRFSITFKTTITYTLIYSTILLTLGLLIISAFGFFLLYETNKSLAMNSQVISALINTSTDIPIDRIKQYTDIEHIRVDLFNEQNHLIYTTDSENQSQASSHRTRLSPTTTIDDRLHFETTANLTKGIRRMEVSKHLAEEIVYMMGLIAAITISFLLTIILTIIIGSRTSRKMLRPIDNMTRTARSISVGDLTTRLDVVESHDELKELAETFNEMLNRLQASFDQQNTFVSDASHELRTPIAVIQGYANLLERWGKEDKAVLQESLDAIKSEADYMKELVDKLLFLARTDKNQQKLETTTFSLDELVDEVLRDTKLICSHHEVTIGQNEIIRVNGDRGLIKQALRIFMDNSIKYTPPGGFININSILQGEKAIVSIEDNGQGISAADLPYIFNRFYKADKSRNRETGGAGLGLSIASWIIEQHRGTIQIKSIENQGTKVILTLLAEL
ncbi:MAG: ATP-binding protein [Syntrophomonas sp.]|nr:ATP-binding protein [Syntrophomonas sp.]